MARFNNCHLTPNLMPQTPNTLLCAVTIQNEDAVTAVKSDIKTENTKSQP